MIFHPEPLPATPEPLGTDRAPAAPDEVELTILMPCLNEAATVARCVDDARAFLRRSGIAGEVVVADNGSTDGSRSVARSRGARVVHIAEQGYGAALRGGIRAARGRYVIMGDADASYDFSRLDDFVARLREGHDLVMGNRFRGGIAAGAMPPLHRYLGNPVLSGLGRLFFGGGVGDFHCGLRGFGRTAIGALELRTDGMEFASEMVVKAKLGGMRVTEVPTVLVPDGRGRPSHLRSWRDGWRHLRFLLMYTPEWLFLYPGLFLIAWGLAVMVAVLPGPIRIGSVVFDVHTLVVATGAILVGTQTVASFLLAKRFATNEGLLPETRGSRALREAVSLERAVAVGAACTVAGLLGLAWAVVLWGRASFGELDYAWMMRLVVPSVTVLAVGVQTVFTGFLLGILDLKLAKDRPGRTRRGADVAGRTSDSLGSRGCPPPTAGRRPTPLARWSTWPTRST
jgi:hypothetical protein